ncbi:MAG: cell division protein FtsL [Deltaproteobacteria bacterium]|nr:cell division protein FtsL [Deltaproteobacteria bacterium]
MASAVSAQPRRIASVKRERPQRSAASRWRIFFAVILGVSLIGVVLAHVWLRLQVVRMGYVLSTSSKLQTRLEQENRELKFELATLNSPDKLEALARQRLGLAPPEKGQVIVLP